MFNILAYRQKLPFGLLHIQIHFRMYDKITILVNEAKDLASNVLPAGLLVVHDTSGGRQNDVAELTRRQELVNPGLDVINLDVETGGDDAHLVKTAVKENSNLTSTVVVNELEVVNVA